MKDCNIFDYLRYFSTEDLRAFQAYLNKYHKGKKKSLMVFMFIKNYHPEYLSSNLSWEYVFKKTFKKEKYSYRKITDATYGLRDLIKEFLAEREAINDKFQKEWYLLLGLKRIGQSELFFQKVEELLNIYRQEKNKDIWSYLKLLQIHHIAYFTTDKEKLNSKNQMVSLALTALESFYLAARLRYICELVSQESLLKKEMSDSLAYPLSLEDMGTNVSHEFYHTILRKSILLINEKKGKEFFELKGLFLKSNNRISKRDQTAIMMYLVNFTAQMIRIDKSEFYQEAFDIYELGIKNRLLVEDGYFSPSAFLNIVNTACYLEKDEWALSFVNEWENKLKSSIRKDIVEICLAHISFQNNAYDDTLDQLKGKNFKLLFCTLVAKGLIIMSYYELDPYEDELSKINNTFQKFLQRDNLLTHSFTRAWLNFSQIFGRIITYNPHKADYVNKLLQDLDDKNEIIKREWLKEKIKNLEK